MRIPIDFNQAEIARGIHYGGDAGAKEAIIYEGEVWLIKYPKTKHRLVNHQTSYTLNPINEYLGSKIYETLGIPVHETLFGFRRGKAVAACKDFTRTGEKESTSHPFCDEAPDKHLIPFCGEAPDKHLTPFCDEVSDKHLIPFCGETLEKHLIPFHNLKNSFMADDPDAYSGTGSETLLDEVLATVTGQEELKAIPGVLAHFWDMFVVDAFLGNGDRNNGNWGILLDRKTGAVTLAPVYDNGSAFFNQYSLPQLETRLKNVAAMREDAWQNFRCVYKDPEPGKAGQAINPFAFIQSGINADCSAAVLRFARAADLSVIERIISSIPEKTGELTLMQAVQKEYYLKLMQIRLEEVLLPFARGLLKKERG